jgi:triphosphoribosyl-dephospho-CoA synthase
VLTSFSDQDTRDVFSAIATASPGGIGADDTADVRAAPPADITLMTAMQIAAHRDLIANEYVTGFARVFDLYRAHYAPRVADGWSAEDAIARTYLATLARVPDTHIARKYGAAAATAVRNDAKAVEREVFSDPKVRPGDPAAKTRLLSFDAALKAQGHNPGSLADMMAAVLFVAELEPELAHVPGSRRNPVTSR